MMYGKMKPKKKYGYSSKLNRDQQREKLIHMFLVKKLPTYNIISNTGPRHKPIFKVGVKLPNTKYFVSDGKSKKEAEQNAANECLKSLN